jgi:hypothetical protein
MVSLAFLESVCDVDSDALLISVISLDTLQDWLFLP